ncbi:prepilin peptidase [Elusimicrobiota bacterium]
MEIIIYLFLFVLGLSLGSFANVCIWRIPQESLSIVKPRSFCPLCRRTIPWYYNIPVFSFILLRGRCAYCKGSIRIRYPVIEIISGLLVLLIYFRFGYSYETFIYTVFSILLLIGSVIDIDFQILPAEITYFLVILGLALSPVNTFLGKSIIISIRGALFGGGLILLFRWLGTIVFKKEAMGMGDVKLMLGIGAFIGIYGVFWSVFLGSCLGSVFGIGSRIFKKTGKYDYIPFGPFLSMGAIIYLLKTDLLIRIFFR